MKRLATGLMFCFLTGCSLFHSSNHNSSIDTDDGGLRMACAHDPYLKKFDCSFSKIQQAAETAAPPPMHFIRPNAFSPETANLRAGLIRELSVPPN